MGATAAITAIITQPAAAPRPATSAARIDGVLALRPDLVRQARWPFSANGGFAEAAGSGSAIEEPLVAEQSTANPAAGSDDSALKVATEFYRRLERDPSTAVKLVAPGLLAGHQAELAQAWDAVTSVRPRVRARPDGVVLAEVEATYPDGDRVVLRQLLTVESGACPKIVNADLLSARHLAPR